jgi:hypothetical protein
MTTTRDDAKDFDEILAPILSVAPVTAGKVLAFVRRVLAERDALKARLELSEGLRHRAEARADRLEAEG